LDGMAPTERRNAVVNELVSGAGTFSSALTSSIRRILDVRVVEALKTPVALAAIQTDRCPKNIMALANSSRLSVQLASDHKRGL
jgi:hypothetical protein